MIALPRASLFGALFVVACGGAAAEPSAYPVVFEASADGRPLEGVAIVASGASLGTTDAEGRLALELGGNDGERVDVRGACPDGYRDGEDPSPLVLRRIVIPGTESPRPLAVAVACEPLERDVVVVVRTPSVAGLPLRIDGREVARTDENGNALFALVAAPRSRLLLELDTSAMPELVPRSPSVPLTVPETDHVFAVERVFSRPTPEPERRTRHRRRPEAGAPECVGPRCRRH